jgi:hypothetical protein
LACQGEQVAATDRQKLRSCLRRYKGFGGHGFYLLFASTSWRSQVSFSVNADGRENGFASALISFKPSGSQTA